MEDLMKARVTKRDKKLHLWHVLIPVFRAMACTNSRTHSYNLTHRIHTARVYPVPAPNGSTIVIYGHERGLRLLWRGGRRRRAKAASEQTNGVSEDQDVMVIDDSDNDQDRPQRNQSKNDHEYEHHEDEQDPDSPYPNIIHDLNIELDSAVLHLAIPPFVSSPAVSLAKTHVILAAACANGQTKVLTVPLAPPADDVSPEDVVNQVDLPPLAQPAYGLTVKVAPKSTSYAPRKQGRSNNRVEAEILVAAISTSLNIWSVDMTAQSIKDRQDPTICSLILSSPGVDVHFNPSSRSRQLLVSDSSGAVRIYEPQTSSRTPGGGEWVISYLSPFNPSGTRKRILASAWVLGGRGILALLGNGSWGVWDVFGVAQGGKAVGDFAIQGFLGSDSGETTDTSRPKKASKLAPMTPNTRKSKSENLFGSISKSSVTTPTGGISVAPNENKAGQADESVVLWYGSDVYSIQSMQQFWTRSTSNTGNSGSLYAPGLTHISDMNLTNENVTSSSQLALPFASSGLGQMNTQRDLVMTGEYRLMMLHSLRPQTPARQLFQQPADTLRDQRKLDAGELDLGGLNRMLDGRADNRPRRVGFAQG